MNFRVTSSGFGIIEFVDQYGCKCSLRESSLASERCIWFGTDGNDGDHMHLSQDMVRALLPALQRFAETGALAEPEGSSL